MQYAVNQSHQKPVGTANNSKNERSAASANNAAFSASNQNQKPFDANILQSLLSLLQQLLELIQQKQSAQQQPKQTDTDNNNNSNTQNQAAPTDPKHTDCMNNDASGPGQPSPEPGADLDLSQTKLNDLSRARSFGLAFAGGSTPSVTSVEDTNNDGVLSAGDTAFTRTFSEQGGNFINASFTVTQGTLDIADRLQNQTPEVPLSLEDFRTLRRINTDSVPVRGAFDNDNNGTLSVGDEIITRDAENNDVLRVVDADFLARFNEASAQPSDPVSVDGATIGASLDGGSIPNDRIVTINGQSYSVGFLKQQADAYANADPNSFDFTPPDFEAQVVVQTDWGTGSTGSRAARFEAYISQTFPNGDPNLN